MSNTAKDFVPVSCSLSSLLDTCFDLWYQLAISQVFYSPEELNKLFCAGKWETIVLTFPNWLLSLPKKLNTNVLGHFMCQKRNYFLVEVQRLKAFEGHVQCLIQRLIHRQVPCNSFHKVSTLFMENISFPLDYLTFIWKFKHQFKSVKFSQNACGCYRNDFYCTG